jgi:hypothetical protein
VQEWRKEGSLAETGYYHIKLIFRFNQEYRFPGCIVNLHRIANTDFFEIYAGTVREDDLPLVLDYLCEMEKDRNLVSSYFEFVEAVTHTGDGR